MASAITVNVAAGESAVLLEEIITKDGKPFAKYQQTFEGAATSLTAAFGTILARAVMQSMTDLGMPDANPDPDVGSWPTLTDAQVVAFLDLQLYASGYLLQAAAGKLAPGTRINPLKVQSALLTAIGKISAGG